MTINAALAALVNDLTADDVPNPLRQEFTLAAVWDDLCRLAGEPVPASVAAIVDPLRPARSARPVRAVPKPKDPSPSSRQARWATPPGAHRHAAARPVPRSQAWRSHHPRGRRRPFAFVG